MIELAVLLLWADSMELASLLTKQTVVTNTKKHFSYFKWEQCSTKHARTSCCTSLRLVVAPTSRTSCPIVTPPTTSSWSSAWSKTPRSAATEAEEPESQVQSPGVKMPPKKKVQRKKQRAKGLNPLRPQRFSEARILPTSRGIWRPHTRRCLNESKVCIS